MGSQPISIPNKRKNLNNTDHDKTTQHEHIQHIGEGSFADVYLNHNTGIIIKRVNIEKVTKNKKTIPKGILKEYIQSEIDIIKNLSHQNIISFVKSEIQDEVYDIYLEHCEYGDVHHLLKNEVLLHEWRNSYGGFTGTFLQDFISQISDGLMYLHQHNIIHRDIKPNNILVNSQCQFKICDFGFSCVDITADKSLLQESNLTVLEKKYFNKSGTPYYMAPEIYSEAYYNTTSDLWSFGVTLYEVYFRNVPFPKMERVSEISNYLSQKESQLFIHDKIISKLCPKILKIILIGLLTIKTEERIRLERVQSLLQEEPMEEIELVVELDECLENNSNYSSKKSSDTWEQVDDLYSVINIGETNDMSNSFLQWLKNNKE